MQSFGIYVNPKHAVSLAACQERKLTANKLWAFFFKIWMAQNIWECRRSKVTTPTGAYEILQQIRRDQMILVQYSRYFNWLRRECSFFQENNLWRNYFTDLIGIRVVINTIVRVIICFKLTTYKNTLFLSRLSQAISY